MDTSALSELGLTGAEVKVFLALLELGSTTAGPVVERSGLQNAVVHRAFHSLAEKGMLTSIQEGRVNHYQAIEPKLLLAILDEKRERLKSILPQLEAKLIGAKEKPKATMFQGIRGVKEMLSLLLDTDAKEYIAYGVPKAGHEMIGDHFWRMFHKKRELKKMEAKLLFHESLAKWGRELNRYPYTTVRTTEKNFEALTETIICGNKVGIVLYLNKPFGFLIEEQAAADSYSKFFGLIWK